MAVPFIAGSTKNSTNGSATSLTLTKPVGVEVGDLLLLLVGNENSANNEGFDTLTGWTRIFNYGSGNYDTYIGAYWRIADGTEGADVTVPFLGNDDGHGWYLRVTGVKVSNPVRNWGVLNATVGNTLTVTAIQTLDNYNLAVSLLSFDGSDGDPFTETGVGFTMQDWTESPNPSDSGNASSGAYSTKGISTYDIPTGTSIWNTDGTSDGMVASMVLISGDESAPSTIEWGVPDPINATTVLTASGYISTTHYGVSPLNSATALVVSAGRETYASVNMAGTTSAVTVGGAIRLGVTALTSSVALTATSGIDKNSSSSLSSSTVLTISASVNRFGDTALTADVALTAIGKRDKFASITMTGTTSAVTVGGAIRFGVIALTSSVAVVTVGDTITDHYGIANLTSATTLTCESSVIFAGVCPLTSDTSVVAVGTVITPVQWVTPDISTSIYAGVFVVPNVNAISGIAFSPDGIYVFITCKGSDKIYRQVLGTAWDITTAGSQTSYDVSTDGLLTPEGVTFSPDGTHMYIIDSNTDTTYQYSLSTAWDITSASLVNSKLTADDTAPRDIYITSNGDKLFIVGSQADEINQYSFSTPWDITTLLHQKTFDTSTNASYPTGIFISPDGNDLFVSNGWTDANMAVHYSLASPFDLTDIAWVRSEPKDSYSADAISIGFSLDGSKMYIGALNPSQQIVQYTFPSVGVDRFGIANLTSATALTASGGKETYASASMSGTTSAVTVGGAIRFGASVLSSDASVNAIGTVTRFGATSLSSSTVQTSTASTDRYASVTLSSATSLAVTAITDRNASLSITSASTVDVIGTLSGVQLGQASLSSSADLTVVGSVGGEQLASASLGANVAVNTIASLALLGVLSLASATALNVTSGLDKLASVSMAGTVSSVTVGGATRLGAGVLNSQTDMTSVGNVDRFGNSTLSATTELIAVGMVDSGVNEFGSASLTSAVNITSISSVDRFSSISLLAEATVDVTATVDSFVFGQASLVGTSELIVDVFPLSGLPPINIIYGDLDILTLDGNLVIESINGDVIDETIDANLIIETIDANLIIETIDGDI